MSDPIIEMPSLRTRLTRLRDWGMTLIWWAFWLYLIREVFFIAADLITARSDEIRMATMNEIITTFAFYFQIIVINGLILVLWARYNRFRFRGKDRRSAKSTVASAEIAESLDMNVLQVEGAQRARRMIVHHDERGVIERVDIAPGDTLSTGLLTSGAAAARSGVITGGSDSRPSRPNSFGQGSSDQSSFGRSVSGPNSFGTRPLTGPFLPPTSPRAISSELPTIVSQATPANDPPKDEDKTIVSRPMETLAEFGGEENASPKKDEVTIVSKPLPPPEPDGNDGKPR